MTTKRFEVHEESNNLYAVMDTARGVPLRSQMFKQEANVVAEIANEVIELVTKPVVLYHGDNGEHEFWQSETDGYALLRNHPETFWSAHRYHADKNSFGFLFSGGSSEEIVARLGNARLDKSRVWKYGPGNKKSMRLMPNEPKTE